MEFGFKCGDVQAVFLPAPNRGLQFRNFGGSGRVGSIGVSVGCGWACGRGSSWSIVEGFVDSPHLLFAFAVIAFDVDFLAEVVHHPKAMAVARWGRTAEVTSGIALG